MSDPAAGPGREIARAAGAPVAGEPRGARGPRTTALVAGALLTGAALAGGCGEAPRQPGQASEGADSIAALAVPSRADSIAAPGGRAAEAEGDSAGAGPVGTPGLGDSEPPPLRAYPLLLVNPGRMEARVFASAGAGRVPLDTLAAGDSARVDVRVRATRLRLEAEAPGGRPLGAEEIELTEGALLRWEVPGPTLRPSEREAVRRPGPGRLVRARTPDYARATRGAGRRPATPRGTRAR